MHKIKAKGIKKLAVDSHFLDGDKAKYIEIFYNKKTKDIWGCFHCSVGGNSWTKYYNKNIILVGTIREPKKMAEIMEMLEDELGFQNYMNGDDEEWKTIST